MASPGAVMNSTSAELVSIQALFPASAAASAFALTSSSVERRGRFRGGGCRFFRRCLFRCRFLGYRPATHHRHAQHAGQGKHNPPSFAFHHGQEIHNNVSLSRRIKIHAGSFRANHRR